MGIRAPGWLCVYVLDSGTLPALPGQGGARGGWRVHPAPRPPGQSGLFSWDKRRFALIGVSHVCKSLFPRGSGFQNWGQVVWAPHYPLRSAPCRRLQAGEEEVSVQWGGCWALWGLACPGDRRVPRCEWQWAWPGTCSPASSMWGCPLFLQCNLQHPSLRTDLGQFLERRQPGRWPGVPCPVGPGDLRTGPAPPSVLSWQPVVLIVSRFVSLRSQGL